MIKASPKFHIGIIGCGKMGKDLFNWLTGFPFTVTWVCHTKEQAEQQREIFVKKQKRTMKYGLESEETVNFRSEHTIITSRPEELARCELVLESITEDVNRKKMLFKELEQILPDNCVLASNTSSISPDKLFAGLSNEENGLGLHFFFPVAMKDLAEINVAKNTGDHAIMQAEQFLKHTNKFYLKLSGKDHFFINRMFLKMQAGCCRVLEEGEIDISEIDALIKQHFFPVGVFEFFDHVGNDVMWQSVKNYVAYETAPDFYRPMIEMLGQKVKEGRLGKKTKAGFYDYPVHNLSSDDKILRKQKNVLQQITGWYLDGVFDVLNRKICNREELEFIVQEYMNTKISPFELAKNTEYDFKRSR